MQSKISIIKIGGNVIDDEKVLDKFLADFASIKHAKILIHGGGKIASQLSNKLGIKTIMNEGRRVTSSESLKVVVMVYAGIINKQIVSKLQNNKCNALGLSGADANCILATKRPTSLVDFGWVGDIVSINSGVINMLLSQDITPVFCAISHDGKGQLLNTNADTIAAEIAVAMSKHAETELIYCFEKKGVLMDVKNDQSIIHKIDSKKYMELKSNKIIDAGMLPKLENCFYALDNKVKNVVVGDCNIIVNKATGTTITL